VTGDGAENLKRAGLHQDEVQIQLTALGHHFQSEEVWRLYLSVIVRLNFTGGDGFEESGYPLPR
jgi:hypothetical protein